jgi:hypothetical protein
MAQLRTFRSVLLFPTALALLVPTALALLVPACTDSHEADRDTGAPPDVGLPPDAPVTFLDACSCDASRPAATCDPQDARPITCPAGICDGPDSWAWDGERCVYLSCGTCEGSDCPTLPHSQAECESAHAACVPSLCRDTGGEWLFHTEECEHYVCGLPQPATCLIGMPVCDCGDGRGFTPGVGCEAITCPEVDPLPPETVCTDTGGTWMLGICCSTTCGEFCDEDCAAPGCVCGELESFDAIRGCVDDVVCHTRTVDQTCTTSNDQLRCEDGLICCQDCGGAGCEPTPHCRVPVCDADPDIDECGNNRLAP